MRQSPSSLSHPPPDNSVGEGVTPQVRMAMHADHAGRHRRWDSAAQQPSSVDIVVMDHAPGTRLLVVNAPAWGRPEAPMPPITITETGRTADARNTTVRVDRGTPHPITVTSPFDADETRLRWTFEAHLRSPCTQQVRARETAESIVIDGEALFMQVFKSTPELSAASQAAERGGLQTQHLDIVGSPTFHQWHWEALREPGRDPFGLPVTTAQKVA
jgi:hypothetical protein